MNSFGIIPGFYLLAIVIMLLYFSVTGEASPKFLIFHLDAVSSQNFFQYMEEGDLPNLKAFFEDGHMIHYGLALFPGGTETSVPHLKSGLDNSCLLYTSDAADEEDSVDLGGRRIIKKKS